MSKKERVHCDTDLYLMLSVKDNKKIDCAEETAILRDSLESAASCKNFDFVESSLRRYEKDNGEQFLLLHTIVQGGEKGVENHIKSLYDADKIISKCLLAVLETKSIKYRVILKEYIFYSQNIKEFLESITNKFPNLEKQKIDKHTTLFLGECVIGISREERKYATKLGRMTFDIIEDFVRKPDTDDVSIIDSTRYIINKFQMIESIERVMVKKSSKKALYLSLLMHLLIVVIFLSFVYSYSYVFLRDNSLAIIMLLILASITGMSIMIFHDAKKKEDVIYK